MDEFEIGKVVHFFDKASVAVVSVTEDSLAVGDSIHITGHATDLRQNVESMQIQHKPVEKVEAGQEVAIKVSDKCHKSDKVFKVVE